MKNPILAYFLAGVFVGLAGSYLGMNLRIRLNPAVAGYVTDDQARAMTDVVARRSFDQGVIAGADAWFTLLQLKQGPGDRMENLYNLAYDRNPIYDPRKK